MGLLVRGQAGQRADIKDPYGKLMEKAGPHARRRLLLGRGWARSPAGTRSWTRTATWTEVERVRFRLTSLPVCGAAEHRVPFLPRDANRNDEDANRQAVSWLQVAPLAVSSSVFRHADAAGARRQLLRLRHDWDHPAFMLDNYIDLLTSSVTLRLYFTASSMW